MERPKFCSKKGMVLSLSHYSVSVFPSSLFSLKPLEFKHELKFLGTPLQLSDFHLILATEQVRNCFFQTSPISHVLKSLWLANICVTGRHTTSNVNCLQLFMAGGFNLRNKVHDNLKMTKSFNLISIG